tara:strand:+ start:2467 stop:2604 length:138 start_codon:yes stop_codon:yes gene_type:complete
MSESKSDVLPLDDTPTELMLKTIQDDSEFWQAFSLTFIKQRHKTY